MTPVFRLTAAILLATVACASGDAKGGAKGDTAAATPPATVPPAAQSAATSSAYTKDLPDSLVHQTKIGESQAAEAALAKIPTGTIAGVELEREGGKLLYSYDIKVPGKSGIDEVHVDAMTGQLVGAVTHEGSADEAKEAADEEKDAAPKKPAVKKPPVS